MSEGEAAKANRAARTRLCEEYRERYEELINEERASRGLPPTKGWGRKKKREEVGLPEAERYWIFARSQVQARVWCKDNGLPFDTGKTRYVGDPHILRSVRIDLSSEKIIFLKGWRTTKSFNQQSAFEYELMRATRVFSWSDITAQAIIGS